MTPKNYSDQCTECGGSGTYESYHNGDIEKCFNCAGTGLNTVQLAKEAKDKETLKKVRLEEAVETLIKRLKEAGVYSENVKP